MSASAEVPDTSLHDSVTRAASIRAQCTHILGQLQTGPRSGSASGFFGWLTGILADEGLAGGSLHEATMPAGLNATAKWAIIGSIDGTFIGVRYRVTDPPARNTVIDVCVRLQAPGREAEYWTFPGGTHALPVCNNHIETSRHGHTGHSLIQSLVREALQQIKAAQAATAL